jgi:hypothetical protein
MNNSIYSVNYTGLTTLLLPPLLRQPSEIAWVSSLAAESQIDNILFTQYLTGSTYPIFSGSAVYTQGNRIVALGNGQDNEIFENLSGSSGVTYFDTNTWLPINPNFIGAEERSFYNSQKIVLEYALNRQFQILPQINNPTSWTGANHVNQIYIATNNVTSEQFVMGYSPIYSSNMTNGGSLVIQNGGQWMVSRFFAPPQQEFTVWVPNQVYYTAVTLSSVSAYTGSYVIGGIVYSVSGY